MAVVDHFSTCYKAHLQHTLSVNILLGLEASLVILHMLCVLPHASESLLIPLSLSKATTCDTSNQTPLPKQDASERLTTIGIWR